jgi:hypothetical protein
MISLLADMVYEGGRSLAPALLVSKYGLEGIGILSGLAEGSGYLLRALSGILADKLGAHWHFMFVGYLLTFSYPLSALYPSLTVFIFAVILERVGKAIRSPSKEALLASVAKDPGRDFAVVELMDQVGAILGPALAFCLISQGFEPRSALILYVVPALVLIPLLLLIGKLKPEPREVKLFWTPSKLAVFSFLIGLSFAQPMMTAGGGEAKGLSSPFVYTLIMISDALLAIPLGNLYSKNRRIALMLPPLLAPASLSLYYPELAPYAGMAIAYEEVVLKAMIAEMGGSGTRYGLAFASLGLGSLLGGIIMPLLSPLELLLYSFSTSTLAVIVSSASLKS